MRDAEAEVALQRERYGIVWDAGLTRRFVEGSGDTYRFLRSNGVAFNCAIERPKQHTAHRMVDLDDTFSLQKAFLSAFEERGIKVRYGHRCRRLIVDAGRVTGMEVEARALRGLTRGGALKFANFRDVPGRGHNVAKAHSLDAHAVLVGRPAGRTFRVWGWPAKRVWPGCWRSCAPHWTAHWRCWGCPKWERSTAMWSPDQRATSRCHEPSSTCCGTSNWYSDTAFFHVSLSMVAGGRKPSCFSR